MSIKIVWPLDLPVCLNGVAVVCDVWAATTNINSLLSKGADKLFLVNANNVQAAKQKYKNSIVIGQSLTLPKTLFDFSNYPSDVEKVRSKNKTILYMTNNGTRIIELAFAKKAHKVFSVSFSNIYTLVKYLKDITEQVYLIPAGEVEFANPKVLEDLVCVRALDSLLKGKMVDIDESVRIAMNFIKKTYSYQNFDQEKNFNIAFRENDLTVVPLYTQTEDGWISASNVYFET